MNQPFTAVASAIDISVTSTASASVALPSEGAVIRIVNEGPNFCWVSIGTGSQVATLPTGTKGVTSTPVPVGDITLTLPRADGTPLNISAISRASQTARLTVQVGDGL